MLVPVMMATVWLMWPQQSADELMADAMGNAEVTLTTSDGQHVKLAGGSEIKVVQGRITCIKDGTLAYESKEAAQAGAENELVVPRGGACSVVLEDGTRVMLNAGSKLRYPVRFAENGAKTVEMEGELYFDVVSDGRPFEVHTGNGLVEVLGTSFGVKAYPQEAVYTTLVSGKVRFSSASGRQVVLAPGEQAVASADGRLDVCTPEIDEYVGWTKGMLVFDDQSLDEVMKAIGRWYGVEVVYAEPQLRHLRFTGSLKLQEEVTRFLDLLQLTGDITYEMEGRTVTIRK